MLTAVRAGAYLHHLSLFTPDPAALARFYADVMDMGLEEQDDGTWACSGPGRRLVFAEGTSRKLRYAAYACRDSQGLEELRARARQEGLEPTPRPVAHLGAEPFSVSDPDGNVIVFGLAGADRESAIRSGMKGPLQHLTIATRNVKAIEEFYAGKLGFAVSDRVRNEAGVVTTCFMRSNHEHHTLACFLNPTDGIDHHSYEAGDWNTIRDWCDRFGEHRIPLMWGPGRHGPGNNLFAFIEDPEGNWIEISAELETIYDRPAREWPHEERSLNLWGRGILRA